MATCTLKNIMELCREYDRLEGERNVLLKGDGRDGVVDPEVFRGVADGLRKTHSAICREIQHSMLGPLVAEDTKVQSYFSAWQSLRLFSQH